MRDNFLREARVSHFGLVVWCANLAAVFCTLSNALICPSLYGSSRRTGYTWPKDTQRRVTGWWSALLDVPKIGMTVTNTESDPSLPGCYAIFTDEFPPTFRSILIPSYSGWSCSWIISKTAVCYSKAVSRNENFIHADFRHATSLIRATLWISHDTMTRTRRRRHSVRLYCRR
jgi:hypothetical protein